MKTTKFEIQTILSEPLTGNPELVREERIKRLQESVILLAEHLDAMYERLNPQT